MNADNMKAFRKMIEVWRADARKLRCDECQTYHDKLFAMDFEGADTCYVCLPCVPPLKAKGWEVAE